MTQPTETRMGYNVNMTPLNISEGQNSNGKRKITGRATIKTAKGARYERTFVAQGAAADAVAAHLQIGEAVVVRAFYDRAPANEDGGRGGEYITLIAMPKAA